MTIVQLLFFLMIPLSLNAENLERDFLCYNNAILKIPIRLSVRDSGDYQMAADNNDCLLAIDESYEAPSKNYENWEKHIPLSEQNHCKEFSLVALGEETPIHWILLGVKVQQGQKGFVQFAYENDWNQENPSTTKTFLKCFPSE